MEPTQPVTMWIVEFKAGRKAFADLLRREYLGIAIAGVEGAKKKYKKDTHLTDVVEELEAAILALDKLLSKIQSGTYPIMDRIGFGRLLYRIAFNKMKDKLRPKHRNGPTLAVDLNGHRGGNGSSNDVLANIGIADRPPVSEKQYNALVEGLRARLNPRLIPVFELWLERRSAAEIMDRLGIKKSTVYMYIKQIELQCKRMIEGLCL